MSDERNDSVTMTCSVCHKSVVSARLPKGWKRTDGVYCDKCWRERYVLRAVTMEVVKPLGEGIGWRDRVICAVCGHEFACRAEAGTPRVPWRPVPHDAEGHGDRRRPCPGSSKPGKPHRLGLRNAVRASCGQATSVTNLIMSRMFAADCARRPADKKFGKFDFKYERKGRLIYEECRKMWPDFPSQSVSAIMRASEGKYRSQRYKILWTGESSLPSARYPQPYPVHNQAWKPVFVPAGKEATETTDLVPAVDVPLVGGRMVLQLRQGKGWRRQVADFRKFVAGEAVKGELAIILKNVNSKAHGNGIEDRDQGGQKVMNHVRVKMVGWFPREQRRPAEGSLLIRRDADALLVAQRETERGPGTVRQWHWEHLRRWVAEHRRRLQMWSDDQKAEQRRPHASFASRREAACRKYRNRMESAQKELAHQVAQLCRRQRVAEVVYDDTDYGYFAGDRWTWSEFETVLANKLNEIGVLLNRKGQNE